MWTIFSPHITAILTSTSLPCFGSNSWTLKHRGDHLHFFMIIFAPLMAMPIVFGDACCKSYPSLSAAPLVCLGLFAVTARYGSARTRLSLFVARPVADFKVVSVWALIKIVSYNSAATAVHDQDFFKIGVWTDKFWGLRSPQSHFYFRNGFTSSIWISPSSSS